jgi:polyphosphate kinase 2 (PPK2 family)
VRCRHAQRARTTQWYFQRYVAHLPAAGEIVLMDRPGTTAPVSSTSWGTAPTAEYHRFLHQAPIFERMLVEDGVILLKYWFSVSDVEQEKRFRSRAGIRCAAGSCRPTT